MTQAIAWLQTPLLAVNGDEVSVVLGNYSYSENNTITFSSSTGSTLRVEVTTTIIAEDLGENAVEQYVHPSLTAYDLRGL